MDMTDSGPGDIILLPEMFPSGFYHKDLAGMADEAPRVIEWMCATAAGRSLAIVGSIPEKGEDGILNSLVFVDEKGEPRGSYGKVHLFPLGDEDHFFVPGGDTVTFSWNAIIVGLLTCFDLRFPEMARKLCLAGAQLILVSAQWPEVRIGHFTDLVRVRAMENQLFIAAANSCGDDEKGLVLGGHSLMAGPMGGVVARMGSEEGTVSGTVDTLAVSEARERFPVLSLRRPEVY
ncbi:2-oxoglutaramate amidase [bacterium BMS3Abin14]|nr:2-oxoglutaramate amidase [bacterium BMS3Abin14]